MTQDFNRDEAYQQWLYEQYLRSQPTQIQQTPSRVREPMPPYRSVEYTPPPTTVQQPNGNSSHKRYKKLQRRRYPDWRMVLGWTCVAGAAMASFNLLLHGIKTVCPVPSQAVVAPPKPKPSPGKPGQAPVPATSLPSIPIPTPPPPRLLGSDVRKTTINGRTMWVAAKTPLYWTKPLRAYIPGQINKQP